MTDAYSVHNEPDFARVYDEDDIITIRRGDLRALLDIAVGSMDFGSGFLNNEDVEILRLNARAIDLDPNLVTPRNFLCLYSGDHHWRWLPEWVEAERPASWTCYDCGTLSPNAQDNPPEGNRA